MWIFALLILLFVGGGGLFGNNGQPVTEAGLCNAMFTEDKATEIFCIADDFCKVFDTQMEKYTIKSNSKRKYHRDSTMSKAEIMVIILLVHPIFGVIVS